MSDNPADAAPTPAPDAAPAHDAPANAPASDAAPGAPAEPAAEPISPEAAKTIEPPRWVKPAIDRLTREKNEARRELELLRRETELYRAMAEGKAPPDGSTAPTPPQPAPRADDVEARAHQLVAREKAEAKRVALVQNGTKEFTPDVWDAKTTVLANLGATDNESFMRAIVAVPEGHKVVAALADDPDRVVSMMRMDPVEMAAEMGRMAAELSAPKPAKPTSAAPPPVSAPAGRPNPTPDIYDTSRMSMKEYAAYRAKTAPASLGGQGRRPR